MKGSMGNPLKLTSLNHISVQCRSVEKSLDFYTKVLGFIPIRRPGSFDFEGAWLFNYGIGIHLIEFENPDSAPVVCGINPKDNHISFQCESMSTVKRKLEELGIEYTESRVKEGGILVDQIFFHDPDGFMIEVCNCDLIPVIPLALDAEKWCPPCVNIKLQAKKDEHQKARVQQAMQHKLHQSAEAYLSCIHVL